MSPAASTSRGESHARRPSNSFRPNSAVQPAETTARATKSSSLTSSSAPLPSQAVHYTLIVRLPFPRNGFQDPEPVIWDATKDKALWKIIFKTTNSKDIDWEATAERFEVELGFLMQQAAWLYERHFESMRTQMRRLTTGGPSAGDDGSIGKDTKGISVSDPSSKRGSPIPPTEPGTPKATTASLLSRTPSNATLTQSRAGSGLYTLRQRPLKASGGSQNPLLGTSKRRNAAEDDAELGHENHDDQDASDSEEEPSSIARSQAFRRLPSAAIASRPALGTLSSEGDQASSEEDPESSDGFLPFAVTNAASSSETPAPDQAATLRSQNKRSSGKTHPKVDKPAPDSSPSASASSAGATPNPDLAVRPGPLSPRHRAHLAAAARREGSEGTPSMGSSFSDLDDASVTQSALEEAMMSNLQAGGGSIASRMSSLGRAFGGSA